MLSKIQESLKELGFKNKETAVYIALTQLGESTAAKIAKKADLRRTTAISILKKLEENGYLTTHIYRGKTYYWIESPKTIASVLENKTEIANQLNELLTSLYRTESHFPSAWIYDTKTSIKKFIEKIITSLDKKSVIYTIDTPDMGNYQKIYSEDVSQLMIDLKNKRSITTHTLIPYNSFGLIASHKIKNQNIVIREMPEEIVFKASLWIIKDMVVHFSGNPPFVAAIKHEMIVRGVKSIYDFLWKISGAKN
jgi:sugar-specific transcriptional regulator TrmB